MAKKPKFYVVWHGRKPGIYPTWEECSKQVTGFNGAEYKSFESRQAAELAFQASYDDYKGQHISSLSQQRLLEIGQPVLPSYAVDAACRGSPGPVEYRCVATATGHEIFRQGPYEQGTNNVGEFLAIVHALAIFARDGISEPKYTDSKNALNWVKARKCRTKLEQTDQNAALFHMVTRAETWLAHHEYENRILKWETEAWGENPADLGRK